VKKENATEEAEEVSSQQREVYSSGAGHLHYDRHETVQPIHAQSICNKEQAYKTQIFSYLMTILSSSQ